MKATVLPLFLLLVFARPAWADDKPPAPKLPLGKDTTYVVGPLDKQGYIDYEAALNAELSKGITSETNAKALLIQALGPAPEGGEGLPPEYFKWLDIPAPPKEGQYLLSIYAIAHDRLGISGERLEALYEFQSRATQRPWAAKEGAPIVEWLKANEKPLAIVHEAVKRPHYFNPLCSRRKEGQGSNLIGTLLPSVQKCREIASALTCRAMLRLGEGKHDDAWNDIIACHRLGRLMSRGGTLIESLVGIAICQIAHNATLAYLDRADLTSEQAMARLKELRALPPLAPMVAKIDTAERMMGLDAVQNIRRGGGTNGFGLVFGEDVKLTEEEQKALEKLDWTSVLQTMNKWYDRMAAAMRLKDRAAREKAFDKLDEELRAATKGVAGPGMLLKLATEKDGGKVVGKAIGDVLMGLLSPAVRKVQTAHDRIEQAERNLHVALALTAYKKDTGRYPAKLADLAPKYLAAVPGDVFSGKELIYKPGEKGYQFYSVGPNGKDDGGNWYNDDPPGDDPGVKMPLPELKKK
jgi:hypothetical protein